MDTNDWMAEQFEANRTHLRAVAYRMLGSQTEADDAVQETWIRLNRSDTSDVANLGGWLTTVVARVCLDVLRSRRTRREEPLPANEPTELPIDAVGTDPEHEAILADSVGLAMLVVLETLAPPERVAFVLHDMFAVPFDEIAPIIRRSPDAARQLASRARRRVQDANSPGSDLTRRREIVDAFLTASRSGDFTALLSVLDPDVVARADPAAVRAGATPEVRGAVAVAETFTSRARFVHAAFVDGVLGVVSAPRGTPRVVFRLTVADGMVVALDLTIDAERIGELDVVLLNN